MCNREQFLATPGKVTLIEHANREKHMKSVVKRNDFFNCLHIKFLVKANDCSTN